MDLRLRDKNCEHRMKPPKNEDGDVIRLGETERRRNESESEKSVQDMREWMNGKSERPKNEQYKWKKAGTNAVMVM